MFDVFLAVVVVQIFVGMDVFTISMQCFSYFIFFFRGIFQNHVVDSDYSCFTASSYGYHYCMPRHQEAQASSWVRKFPCRFSRLLIAFSPRSRPLFLRVTVQYLVFFEAVLFGCHATLPPQFLWGSAAWHPKKRLRRRVSIIGTIFFFVLSRMCAFANELFRWKVVSLTSCFVNELFRSRVVSLKTWWTWKLFRW